MHLFFALLQIYSGRLDLILYGYVERVDSWLDFKNIQNSSVFNMLNVNQGSFFSARMSRNKSIVIHICLEKILMDEIWNFLAIMMSKVCIVHSKSTQGDQNWKFIVYVIIHYILYLTGSNIFYCKVMSLMTVLGSYFVPNCHTITSRGPSTAKRKLF